MWLWGNNITIFWGGVPIETLWMRFTCFPNLMLLASPWLEIGKFSNWSFCWLWAIENWVILLSLGKWKLNLFVYFYCFKQVTIIFLSLGKTLGRKKLSKPSLFDKKLKNHAWHKSFSMISQQESGTGFPSK